MNHEQNERILKLTVKASESIKAAMRAIDNGALGIAFIIDNEGKFVGLVTDGDVRRATLKGANIEKPVIEIANTTPITIQAPVTEEELLALRNKETTKSKVAIGGSLKIPVLDNKSTVKDIVILYPQSDKASLLSKHEKRELGPVRRVLVIGAAGYLGSVLTHKLLSRGYLVNGLDNLMYGNYGIKDLYNKAGFHFIQGDIRDSKVLMQSIKNCDAVIHLAAIVGDPACQLDSEETIGVNYFATKMITEVCKYSQINRFIFASTCSVYGASKTPGDTLTEDSQLNPVSLYAEMKRKSETGILEAMDENFSPTLLRMATLYGLSPRMRFDLVLNLLTARAVKEGVITIFGGNQWRPLLHVDDAAEAYILCLEATIEKLRGQIFNVGSTQENYKIAELGNLIKNVVPDISIDNNEGLTDERNYSVSFDRIADILEYRTEKTVRDGIIEIKNAFDKGILQDYTDRRFSNYESLSEGLE